MFVLGERTAELINRMYYIIRSFTISKFTYISDQNDLEGNFTRLM